MAGFVILLNLPPLYQRLHVLRESLCWPLEKSKKSDPKLSAPQPLSPFLFCRLANERSATALVTNSTQGLFGLSFMGDYAEFGFSHGREYRPFQGLTVGDNLSKNDAEAHCGLFSDVRQNPKK